MSASRLLNNRLDDLPIAIAMLAMSMGKTPIGCAIADGNLISVGWGEDAELEAVAKFGTTLNAATVYTTRVPNDTVLKFLEKCGLRRMVVLESPPDGHNNNSNKGMLFIEYDGVALYRLRDMVKVLEQTW